jgi:hypothetical protein
VAEHDSSEVTYQLDNPAGTLTAITQYVLDGPGILVSRGTDDDWTPLGATTQIKGIVAIDIVDDVDMTLKMDSALRTILSAAAASCRGAIRTFTITLYSGGPTKSIELGITRDDYVIAGGKKTRIHLQGVNTGAITET